jgi:hypothetical protein
MFKIGEFSKLVPVPEATLRYYEQVGLLQPIKPEAALRWIEAHGYRIAGPDREINIYNTQPIRYDDDSYVTEIQHPVKEPQTHDDQ